jgi:trypsin
LKRTRLVVVALLAIVLPSLSQAADARPVRPGGDIIGGDPAATGEFTFMAAILDETIGGNDFDKQFCGGSLIAADWVLTAAHCAKGASPEDLAVAVGRTLLDCNQGERRRVVEVHVHPDFNDPISLAHDAALLKLAPRTAPSGINPIPLAVAADDHPFEDSGEMLTVIGWGTVSARRPAYPNELRKVDVPVVDDATCGTVYKTSLDAATMVCAGAPNIDSCYGDSGGPLFGRRDDGSPVQIGIVSWGNGCAKKRFPGVYSEVNNSDIRSWITTTAGV